MLMFWKHMYVYSFGGLEILEGREEDPFMADTTGVWLGCRQSARLTLGHLCPSDPVVQFYWTCLVSRSGSVVPRAARPLSFVAVTGGQRPQRGGAAGVHVAEIDSGSERNQILQLHEPLSRSVLFHPQE